MTSRYITIRLPKDINTGMQSIANLTGLSKTDVIRIAVLTYLDKVKLDHYRTVTVGTSPNTRINVKITPLLDEILMDKAEQYATSINGLVIYALNRLQKQYSDRLE